MDSSGSADSVQEVLIAFVGRIIAGRHGARMQYAGSRHEQRCPKPVGRPDPAASRR